MRPRAFKKLVGDLPCLPYPLGSGMNKQNQGRVACTRTPSTPLKMALRAEEGISNELDYVEQTSWVLFLKYLHDLESERGDRAELEGKSYAPIIDGRYRWDR